LLKTRSLVQVGKVRLEVGEAHNFAERLSFGISPRRGFAELHRDSQRAQHAGKQALRETSPRAKAFRSFGVAYGHDCNGTHRSHANAKMKVKKQGEVYWLSLSVFVGLAGKEEANRKLRYMRVAKGWHQRSAHITVDKIEKDVKRRRN